MPNAIFPASPQQPCPTRARSVVGPAVLALGLFTACASQAPAAPSTAPGPQASASPAAQAAVTPESASSLDTTAALCAQVGAVAERTAALRAVELRLPNRVALDIELGKLQAAFAELDQTDLGTLEDRLEGPLTRLGYRLAELELAVEDFRTNPRPQRATAHVETDARTFGEELGAFVILARCG